MESLSHLSPLVSSFSSSSIHTFEIGIQIKILFLLVYSHTTCCPPTPPPTIMLEDTERKREREGEKKWENSLRMRIIIRSCWLYMDSVMVYREGVFSEAKNWNEDDWPLRRKKSFYCCLYIFPDFFTCSHERTLHLQFRETLFWLLLFLLRVCVCTCVDCGQS